MTGEARARPWLYVAPSVALFCAAAFFDIVVYRDHTISGAIAMTLGWLAIGSLQFGWLANPLLIVVWLRMVIRPRRQNSVAVVGAWLALGLGASSLYTLASGAITREVFVRFGVGFYLWLAALVAQVLGATLQRRAHRTTWQALDAALPCAADDRPS